ASGFSGELSLGHTATNHATPFTVPLSGTGVSGFHWAPVVADAFVLKDLPTTNYGSDTNVWVGKRSEVAGLLRFDLGAIPNTATIETALLRLYVTNLREAETGLACRASAFWLERGNSGVTWSTKPDRQGTCVNMISPLGEGYWLEVDVTAVVISWISDGQPNFGFHLEGYGERALQYTFASREWTDSSKVPQLYVQYR
ncbi:DNRLRE domain-containing protein, partial [Gemmatimonadota bacterium]